MYSRAFPLLCIALFQSNTALAVDEPNIEADCKKIASYVKAGNELYAQKRYAQALEAFQQQVAWSESCQLTDSTIATAYNNVALTYIRMGEWLKAKAYLSLAPNDKKTQFNYSLIADQLKQLKDISNPTGVYWQYAGRGQWSVVEVSPEGTRWRVQYHGLYMPIMGIYYGPNIGSFSALLDIHDHFAVYKQSEQKEPEYDGDCAISLKFSPQQVTLSTAGDCGFGHNVIAEGEFMRVSLPK